MLFRDKGGPERPRRLPLLPLRELVVFPYAAVSFIVGRERSIAALNEAMRGEKEIFLVTQREATTRDPTPEELHIVGTIATVVQVLRLPDATVKVLVEGLRRGKIARFVPGDEHFVVEVEEMPDPTQSTPELAALVRQVKEAFDEYVKLNKALTPDVLGTIQGLDEPIRLSDTLVRHLVLKTEQRQQLLEMPSAHGRLEAMLRIMQSEIDILQVEKKIKSRVKKQMERSQKEYYLNEQMQAIQKELGDRDEFRTEIQELEAKAAELELTPEARDRVERELRKLKLMSPMSAEAAVVRNYLEVLLAMPWGVTTEDQLDVELARKVLDEDHSGSFQMVGGRVADAHEELGLFGGGVADARQGYLPALARLVHAHGAQLVVVFAPTAARFQPSQYLPDAAEAEILALGNELGVGWVDLRQMKLSDDAFKDGRHMRPPAAKEFTLQLAERITAIGATRPGPLVRPIAPLALQSVERIGAGPTLDLGTVAAGDGPCKATITLTGAASLAEPRLATLPWRRRSPIEVVQGDRLLKRTRGGEALTDGCIGKYSYADGRIDVRLAKGPSGAIELRLADALPVRDGKEDEAWWLWPSTSLKWTYGAPPEAEGAELTVDVEVRPVETAAAAPVVRVGERQVELSLESGRFVGSLSVPRPEGPWSIEVESPAGAAYAEVHALTWHVGEQLQDVVAPAVMRWADLAKAAEVRGSATSAFATATVTPEGDHGWIAAPWRNVSGCSPLSVLADGAPLEHARPDSFDARMPPESGLAHLKDRLWFPAAAAGSSPAYTVGLDPERRCWAKACRSCGTRLWVYPGDKLTISPSEDTRRAEGGLRLARVRVLAVAAAGESDAAPLAFELRLGDQTVATAALSLAAMAKGDEVPVRPPVIGHYGQPLTIELQNPAENPPMLFTLWGGAD